MPYTGLICHHCNKGIGHFQEQLEMLNRAADYMVGG